MNEYRDPKKGPNFRRNMSSSKQTFYDVNFRSSITVFPGKKASCYVNFRSSESSIFPGKKGSSLRFWRLNWGALPSKSPRLLNTRKGICEGFFAQQNCKVTLDDWNFWENETVTLASQPWIPSAKCMHNTPNLRSTKIRNMRMMMKLAWSFFSGVSVCMSSLPYLPPMKN